MATEMSRSALIHATGVVLKNDYRTWPILRIPLVIHGVNEGCIDISFFSETPLTHTEVMEHKIGSNGVILSHGPSCHATLHLQLVSPDTVVMVCHTCYLRITASQKEIKTVRDFDNYLRIRYGERN